MDKHLKRQPFAIAGTWFHAALLRCPVALHLLSWCCDRQRVGAAPLKNLHDISGVRVMVTRPLPQPCPGGATLTESTW